MSSHVLQHLLQLAGMAARIVLAVLHSFSHVPPSSLGAGPR
jgi:hypothetical protein